MEKHQFKLAATIGAYSALIGSLCMLIGAALWGASGADLDQALDNGQLTNYLEEVKSISSLLLANLTFWIVGVIILGVAGMMMSSLCNTQPILGGIARYIYGIAVPLAIASFIVWLVLVVRLSPDGSPTAALVADSLGWFASRADWVATILIVGLGPFLLSIAGRQDWVPKWLYNWGLVAFCGGFVCLIAIFAGGLSSYGFLVVPTGISWTIASSIVLFKYARKI
jgi:hypothetical protein